MGRNDPFIWPIRPSRTYTPQYPEDSWHRRGYAAEWPYNPRGEHQATDFRAPVGSVVQLPWQARIDWKGWYGDLGNVIEVYLLAGPWRGRFMRFCHLQSYADQPYGTVAHAGWSAARVGMTGRTTGAHCHIELGDHKLVVARFPKRDFRRYALDAYQHHRWAA